MHIPDVNATQSAAPSRLLQQVREAATDVVPAANPSVEVSLSPDARLASLLDRIIAGEGQSLDARQVVRLLGEGALFAPESAQAREQSQGIPLPTIALTDPATGASLSLQEIGRNGFDPARLVELLENTPEALPLVQASITAAGLDTLFEGAADDSTALPATIRLYLDNGGVPGVQIEPPQPPRATPLAPLP